MGDHSMPLPFGGGGFGGADNMATADMLFMRKTSGSIAGTGSTGVAAASPYSYRPPEPPHIIVPPTTTENTITAPTFNGVGGDDITEADLRIITQTEFNPVDNSTLWKYEWRRQAQKILPFLYLGPWEVCKGQQQFLRDEEISMLLVVRDKATANAGIMNPKKYAEQLGISYDSVDVQDNQELITAFPRATKVINDHLLNCYRQQVQAAGPSFVPGQSPFRMGKVFVFCESGNDRSAAIVAAYVLAMYEMSLVYCLQFVQAQRFCVSFDEPLKNLLKSYEDILGAQRDVVKAQKEMIYSQNPFARPTFRELGSQEASNRRGMFSEASNASSKRGRRSDEDDMEMSDDEERFVGRGAFQPFVQEN